MSRRWILLKISGDIPSPRSACLLFGSSDLKNIYLIGGYRKEQVTKDLERGVTCSDYFRLTLESTFIHYCRTVCHTSLIIHRYFLKLFHTASTCNSYKWVVNSVSLEFPPVVCESDLTNRFEAANGFADSAYKDDFSRSVTQFLWVVVAFTDRTLFFLAIELVFCCYIA